MKKMFIVIGSDGMYEQSSYEEADTIEEVRDSTLKDIAEGYAGDWEPTRYTIREVVGTELVIDEDAVEAAVEIRIKRDQADWVKQQEKQEREQYERLKKRFGDK